MSRRMVFQHVAAEPLGTLHARIRERGHRVRIHIFQRHPDAESIGRRVSLPSGHGAPTTLDSRT